MSDIETRFEAAAAQVRSLPERPDNQALLQLYALYKQATMGDVTGERPGFSNIVERFKFDAWHGLKGEPGDQAMSDYIELVTGLTG